MLPKINIDQNLIKLLLFNTYPYSIKNIPSKVNIYVIQSNASENILYISFENILKIEDF